MSRIQALLIAIFSAATLGVGLSEVFEPQSQQAAVIAMLVAAGGMSALALLVILYGFEVEQSKSERDFIGVAGTILEESSSYGIWQNAIDRLNVIANRTVWCPLQKRNAQDARDLLDEAGEGEGSLSALLRANPA